MVVLYVRYLVNDPAVMTAFEESSRAFVERGRAWEGNISFTIAHDMFAPGTVHMHALWDTPEQHKAFVASEAHHQRMAELKGFGEKVTRDELMLIDGERRP
jgi:quinol monooxygenase YgiN